MNTSLTTPQTCELLSALADGEIGAEEFGLALQACEQDDSMLVEWGTYHLIGNVLRSPLAAPAGDMAFLKRLQTRLAGEAPAMVAATPASLDPVKAPTHDSPWVRGQASNDDAFRWKMVAGFASLAAVSAIAWSSSGLMATQGGQQLAQGAETPSLQQVVVASPQGPVVRDARLEELLAPHRQLGGMSALQAPSGFLQAASFEAPRAARR